MQRFWGAWSQARLLVCLLVLCTSCQSPYYADRGAAVGGLTGAGVGAAIGHASGNTGAGALIGSAVGALSGVAVGSSIDRSQAENRAYVDQRLAERQAGAATINDAISMTRAGLSDEVIANHFRTQGIAQPATTQDLIALKQYGVSDTVIRTVQEMGAVPPPMAASPVVVQERYIEQPVAVVPMWGPRYVDPWCVPPPPRYAHRGHPGISWGVSVRH